MRANRSGRTGMLGLALLAGLVGARGCEDPQKGSGGREPERDTRPWFYAVVLPDKVEPPDSDGSLLTSGQAATSSEGQPGSEGPLHGLVASPDGDAGRARGSTEVTTEATTEVLLVGDRGPLATTHLVDGRFRFDVPPPGARLVVASRAGYPMAVERAEPGAWPLLLGLAEPVPLAGRVTAPDGQGLAGVRVGALARDAEGRVVAASRAVCTGEDGSFRLPDAPAGEAIEVVAQGRDGVSWGALVPAKEPGGTHADLELVRPGSGRASSLPQRSCEAARSRPESAGGTLALP